MQQKVRWALMGGVLALAAVPLAMNGGRAEAQAAIRGQYDFEDGVQGFAPIVFKNGTLAADTAATATVVKELAKTGQGALSYSYKLEAAAFHALVAETKLPAGTQSMTLALRSSVRTVVMLSLREEDGSSYELPAYVPAHEWVTVSANLSEFRPGTDGKDENEKLDVDQIRQIAVLDIANIFVNSPPGTLTTDLTAQRQIFLDDLKFSAERVTQASGDVTVAGQKARLLGNFESGLVDWLVARVTIGNNTPAFDLFPESATLKILTEAAAPGPGKTPLDPGGKGLRISYKRGAQEIFAFVRSFENQPLPATADRLRLSINAAQKSMLLIQVKEKDDSEYQYVIAPDNSMGWQNLDLPLTSFTLGDNSKDENQKLDPDQIKELSILDASAFVGLGATDTTLDLDAVYFTVK